MEKEATKTSTMKQSCLQRLVGKLACMKPQRRIMVKFMPESTKYFSVQRLISMSGTSGCFSQLWMEKNTKRWIPIAFAQLINATLPSQSTYSTINPTKSVIKLFPFALGLFLMKTYSKQRLPRLTTKPLNPKPKNWSDPQNPNGGSKPKFNHSCKQQSHEAMKCSAIIKLCETTLDTPWTNKQKQYREGEFRDCWELTLRMGSSGRPVAQSITVWMPTSAPGNVSGLFKSPFDHRLQH